MGEKNKISVAYDIEKAHPSISHLGLFNNCENVWKTDLGLFFEHSKETETLPYSNVEVEIITLEEYDSCSQEKENAFKIINSDSSGYESAENFNLSNCLAGMYQCQFCPKFYPHQRNLKRHVDKHHNSENRNKKVSSSLSSPALQHDLQSKKEAEKDEKLSDLKSFENQLLFMDELENLSIKSEKVQDSEEKTKRINNSNITEEDSIELEGKNLNENARKGKIILNKHRLGHKSKSLVKRVKFRVNKEYGNRVRQKLNLDPKKCADKSRKHGRKKKTRFWFPVGLTEEKTQLGDEGISNHSPDGNSANCNDVEDGSENETRENNDQNSDSMCNRDSSMNNVVANSSSSDPNVSNSNTELSSDAVTAPTVQGNRKTVEDANAALIADDNQLLFMDELENIEVENGNGKNENGGFQECDKNKIDNGSINGNKCNRLRRRRVNRGSCIIRRSDRIRTNAKKAQSDKETILISDGKSDNNEEANVAKEIVVSHLDTKLSRCADSSKSITNDKTTNKKEHSCISTDSNNNISSNSIEECGNSNNNSFCNSVKGNIRNRNSDCNSINSIANQSNSVSENSPCKKSNLSFERNDDSHDTCSNVNGTNIDSISEKISKSGKCSSNIDLVSKSNEFKSISSTNSVSAFDLLFSDELESIETKEMYHESKNSKDSIKASNIPIESGRDSNPTAMSRCQLSPEFYTSSGFSEKYPDHFPRLHVEKKPDVFECRICREEFHEKLRVGKYILESHSHTTQPRRNIDLNNNTLSKSTVRNCNTMNNCIISCSKDDMGSSSRDFDMNYNIYNKNIVRNRDSVNNTINHSMDPIDAESCSKDDFGRDSSSNIVIKISENACIDSESSETTKEDSLECTICLEKFDDKISSQFHVLSMDDMDHKRGEDSSTIDCQRHNIQKSDSYSKSLDHKNREESFPSGTGSREEERSNIFETLSKYETEHFSSSLDINLNNNTTSTKPMISESVSSNENKSTVFTTTSKVKKGRYWRDFTEIICIDGRKTFKCKLCSFVSKWQRSAARHIQVHFSPCFSCEKCGKQIRSRDALLKHIKYCRSRGQELKCDHCMRVFSTRSALTQHLKMKWCLPGVGNVGTKCNYCGKVFSNHISLRGHIMTKSCSRSWVV